MAFVLDLGPLADLLVSEFEAQKPAIESLLSSGETTIEAEIAKLLMLIPKPSGFSAVLVGPIETAFEAAVNEYAKQLAAQYGADALYGLIDAQFHIWAKDLGG
jgi:hypothetical protein